ETSLVERLAGGRRIGGGEGDGLVFDLLEAAARADRLVVQADVGLFLVGIGPFRIDRIRKGRSGARYVDCDGGRARCRGDESGCCQGAEKVQGSLLFVRDGKPNRGSLYPSIRALRP